MKKALLFIVLITLFGNKFFSQNVGIGTTSPTNTLHVIVSPTNPNPNPVRFEGIQRYTTEDSVLVVNPSTGEVKYMPMADVLSNISPNILDSLILSSVLNNTDTIYNNQSVRDSIIAIALGNSDTLFSTQTFRDSVLGTILSNMDTIFTITRDSLLNDSTFINTLRDSIDTDIDSVTFANDTIYIYENGTIVQTYINTSLDTALVDSLILSSSDTLYTIISDSLTKDTNWIKQIDSLLSIYGDTIYFNDSTYTLIKDSLLNDTAWLSELQDSINTDDQNIDSLILTGTILTTYIEDGTSASVDVSNMLDSVIFSKSDTLYSIISDSLRKDSLWIKQIDSLLSIYGDTIYFNDSSYTLVRDSLLNDSLFLDSLVSLIGDSINTDDQNIDSVTIHGTILTTYIEDGTSASVDVSSMLDSVIFSKSDTLYSIISDSLRKDSLWIKQIDSLLSIYGDTIYFNDSSYTLVRDSLLNDSLFLDSLVSLIGDSINTDDQNIDSLTITGTILTTYIEDGTSASVDVSNMLDSVIFSKSDTLYSIISDSLTKDTNWIKEIDSLLSIYGDTIYFNDSSYTLIRDSLLKDSLFMDSLISLIGDSIDTDIDSVVLIGDTLHIYEDGVDATADISGILDSIRTVDSLFTPDYVIFADSNGRLSEDTVKHFKTVINNRNHRTLLLNTDSIVTNAGNSNFTLLQAYYDNGAGSYKSVTSLEDGYMGLNMMGGTDAPTLGFRRASGDFNSFLPLDIAQATGSKTLGTILFTGKDSVNATSVTQAHIQATSRSYNNQRLLTGFQFSGRTKTTPGNPNAFYGYDFINYHNNSELLLELNNDGEGGIKAHFYKDSRNDTTPINNFIYTDANGMLQSKSVDTLIQLMRDSLDDADWNINSNTTGLEAAPAANNVASGAYSIAAGYTDSATGDYSVIAGGRDNSTTGDYSTITGGVGNQIYMSDYSFIHGQNDTVTNLSNRYGSAILVGEENKVDDARGTAIIGGARNKIYKGNWSIIAAGPDNEMRLATPANEIYNAGIIAGADNLIIGNVVRGGILGVNASVIIGGSEDTLDGVAHSGIYSGLFSRISHSFRAGMLAGRSNVIDSADRATISGGWYNTVNKYSHSSTISGGENNSISSSTKSSITGGDTNNITSAVNSSIIGGQSNNINANADNSTIIGGTNNTNEGLSSTILGGDANLVSGDNSLAGGVSDTVTGDYSSVLGGRQNKVTGNYASITGGYQNVNISSTYGVLGGGYRDSIVSSSYAGIFSGGLNRITSSSYATIPGGYYNKVNSSSYANVSGYYNTVTGSSYANVHGYRHYMDGSFNGNTIFGYQDTAIRTVEGSFIAGRQNAIIATAPAITGRNTIFGHNNKIYVLAHSSNVSFSHSILGGTANTIETSPSGGYDVPITIVGGMNDRVLSHTSGNSRVVIVGGDQDTVQGSQGSVLIGGAGNKAYNGGGWHALIGGANNQVQQQWFSGIYSGWRSKVSNSHSSAIIAGWDNTITSGNNKSAILAGDTNVINNGADNAIILGGRGNVANNFGQTVLGHFSTNTVPTGSSASAIDSNNIILKVGNGTDAANRSDAMVVKANGNVGIGENSPNSKLQITGAISKPIALLSAFTTLDETYSTVIMIGGPPTWNVTLPAASSCVGRIYTIVNKTASTKIISPGYYDLNNNFVGASFPGGTSVTLQSDGTNWQQIK